MQISLKQIAAINRVSFSNAVDGESKFQKPIEITSDLYLIENPHVRDPLLKMEPLSALRI